MQNNQIIEQVQQALMGAKVSLSANDIIQLVNALEGAKDKPKEDKPKK